MKKALLIAALATSINGVAQNTPAGKPQAVAGKPVFVEEVKKTGQEIVIPYKQYKLPNGLTIIIHEDHSDPICYVDVTYHVGSAREQQGRSGFAHFFEHMMFQGSKNVADEQHFKIITESGGQLNGTTNTDRTNYFETVPGNQLEKMLWLEADRMGFLLDSVTQRKFEVQRATVKNERGQRYDNSPYGVVGEKISEALYPQGHPYSWQTIGYIVDLDRVDVNDLKRFYMRWYGPNNAVLTVAGDVNTEDVLVLAQKYFGSIQAGPAVRKQVVPPFRLDNTRYISYEDNVKFPMLNTAYPTAAIGTKDDAALDVLAQILAGSQGSPLYKAFIEQKKAVSASAFQYSRELSGQFQFVIRANQGTALAETEKLLKTTLDDWEKKGATQDDLDKFKAQYKSNTYNQLSTVQGKGSTLASYFTIEGNANNLKRELERHLTVTKEDVMRVYVKYIKNHPGVVLSCLPNGKGELRAKADTWKMYERAIESESAEYKNLAYKEPKDEFNRGQMPAAQQAKPVPVPDYYAIKTTNGIPVIGISETEIPKVNILITFKAGHRFEPRHKSGQAMLLSAMLEQSTMKTSADEIENKLDRLGSSVDFYSGEEDLVLSISCLRENIKPTMAIVEECFFEPKFDPTEFELEKKKQLDAITQQQSNASALADLAYRRVLYGPETTMGLPSNGTAETVNNIQEIDIKRHYNNLNASVVSVAVSGDIKKENILEELKFLTRLREGAPLTPEPMNPPAIEKTKIYFVDKKDAKQSEIRIGYLALPFDAFGDYYKNTIMNFSFAGAFNSRTNYLLREIKGWTYGTRGGFSGSKFQGPYTISGGFKANTTDSTIVEMFNELKKFSGSGINNDEIIFTRNAMMQSDALKYESPQQKLGFIRRLMEYNLPKDYVAQQAKILQSITKDEIDKLAKTYLPYNKMAVVIVGDKASNFEKIKKLGFDVVEMDATGKVLE